MEKVVIYARVSSREQQNEGYSIPAQLRLLNDYAQKHGYQVIQEFVDSETAKRTGRTNFGEMLQFLKKNKSVKTILVEKTDRLYRNVKDYIVLEDLKLEVHLVKEGVILSENSKSQDKFMHGIRVLMAKNYIDNLSEEVKKGMKEKAEQGEWPTTPPYGYKRVSNKVVAVNPENAPFVKRAFELYATGDKSLETVRQLLYKEAYLYRSYLPKISKGMLEHTLKNIFYTGMFNFKGCLYNGVHEPIISSDLYHKVQECFKKDNKPLYRNEHEFLFAGLMTCGRCGCAVTSELKKKKYVYYHCTWGRGGCDQKKYIRQEALESQFEQVIKNICISEEHKEWIAQALKSSFEDEQAYHKEKVTALKLQLDKLKARTNKIYIDKLDGLLDEATWKELHNQWKVEMCKLQVVIDAHEKSNLSYLESGSRILELANSACDIYLGQSSEKRVEMLKMLLSNCTLMDGKISYIYKKPFDILAEGLNFEKNWAR